MADDDNAQEETSDLFTALETWHEAHPDAGWSEIERGIEDQLDQLRRQAWERLTDAIEGNQEKRACPGCGGGREARGQSERTLTLPGNEQLRLRRQYLVCQLCGVGGFPVDEVLGLLPGGLSPGLQEVVVRLGARLPFAEVAEEISRLFRVSVSDSTTCRLTEQAGAMVMASDAAEVERLEREQPEPPRGPAVQQLSADGAMVPLCHGQWAEVKTMAIGTVVSRPGQDGVALTRTTDISYFSRLADHQTFSRLSLAELHRRGTERAEAVVAVMDGSEWLQKFIDLHRPDAVRILDFPHAVEHLAAAAQARFGPGSAAATAWLNRQASVLCHGDPDLVLSALRDLPAGGMDSTAAQAAADATLAYLTKRRRQIAYATFQKKGYPIGSGMVESANKLVVQARLKGSGMHWAGEHVNPLLSLRTNVCNGSWDIAWQQVVSGRRDDARARGERRRRLRHEAQAPAPADPRTAESAPPTAPTALPISSKPRSKPSPKIVNGRPTPDHPWRRPLNQRQASPGSYARM
ncbi:MAG TPA: ISKra4 family transposase [Chloroflexota bacterium]|jgi:hypothetical protein